MGDLGEEVGIWSLQVEGDPPGGLIDHDPFRQVACMAAAPVVPTNGPDGRHVRADDPSNSLEGAADILGPQGAPVRVADARAEHERIGPPAVCQRGEERGQIGN